MRANHQRRQTACKIDTFFVVIRMNFSIIYVAKFHIDKCRSQKADAKWVWRNLLNQMLKQQKRFGCDFIGVSYLFDRSHPHSWSATLTPFDLRIYLCVTHDSIETKKTVAYISNTHVSICMTRNIIFPLKITYSPKKKNRYLNRSRTFFHHSTGSASLVRLRHFLFLFICQIGLGLGAFFLFHFYY